MGTRVCVQLYTYVYTHARLCVQLKIYKYFRYKFILELLYKVPVPGYIEILV